MEMSALREALPDRTDRTDRTKETRPGKSHPLDSDASSHRTVSTRSYLPTSTHDGGMSVRSSSNSISERSSIVDFVSRTDSLRSSADRAQLYRAESSPRSVTQRPFGERSSTVDFISQADSRRSSVDSRVQSYRADPRPQSATQRSKREPLSMAEFISQADSKQSSVDSRARLYRADPRSRAPSKRNMDALLARGSHVEFQPAPWDLRPSPKPSRPFQPTYPLQYGDTHSAGSSTVRFTSGTQWREQGCTVASIATIAKVSYQKARKRAAAMAAFDGSEGMCLSDAENILATLGVSATTRNQGSRWSDLPDLAIVTVHDIGSGDPHAVVFKRKTGEELVYDFGVVRRPSDYQLYSGGGAEYLEIHR